MSIVLYSEKELEKAVDRISLERAITFRNLRFSTFGDKTTPPKHFFSPSKVKKRVVIGYALNMNQGDVYHDSIGDLYSEYSNDLSACPTHLAHVGVLTINEGIYRPEESVLDPSKKKELLRAIEFITDQMTSTRFIFDKYVSTSESIIAPGFCDFRDFAINQTALSYAVKSVFGIPMDRNRMGNNKIIPSYDMSVTAATFSETVGKDELEQRGFFESLKTTNVLKAGHMPMLLVAELADYEGLVYASWAREIDLPQK